MLEGTHALGDIIVNHDALLDNYDIKTQHRRGP